MLKTNTVIIGAGPAGLAVAARLRKAEVDFEILEQNDKPASRWHTHYDRLCLHTVKQFSSLPFMDFPEHYPLYVPRQDLIAYFDAYVERFAIQPHYKTLVTGVAKTHDGWEVQCEGGQSYLAKQVVIATGINNIPKIPYWEGQERFRGQLIHASQYKNPAGMEGKKVLVVGAGNTGFEIALDLAEHQVDVSISFRGGVVIVPREIFGNSIQLSAKRLSVLPFGLGDWIGNQVRKWYIGDLKPYGVPVSDMPPGVLRRKHGRTPTIDLGTVEKIKSGAIKVCRNLKAYTETTVLFDDNQELPFDVVILATGYYGHVNSLIPQKGAWTDSKGIPKEIVGKDEQKGLFFTGFDQYSLDGTLGTLKTESEIILQHILNH